jgi:hypothetical protein
MSWLSRFFSDAAGKALRPTAIADVRDGQRVTIVGTVHQLERLLTAPIRSKPCVYYFAEVIGRCIPKPEEEGGESTRRVFRDWEAVEFLLRDPTGIAQIGARFLDVDATIPEETGTPDRQWCDWHLAGKDPVDRYEGSQRLLSVGAHVLITGTACVTGVTDHPFRDRQRKVRFEGTADERLRIEVVRI